jgi:hypothetical protein
MTGALVCRSVGAAIIDRGDAVPPPIPLRRRSGERVGGGGPGARAWRLDAGRAAGRSLFMRLDLPTEAGGTLGTFQFEGRR